MGSETAILKVVPIAMSARVMTKALGTSSKKRKKKKIFSDFTEILVGTALTKETADFIGGM